MTARCPRCGGSLIATHLGPQCISCGRYADPNADLATYTARAPIGVAPGMQRHSKVGRR
jgi:uncharacterized protein (DUF983 family)